MKRKSIPVILIIAVPLTFVEHGHAQQDNKSTVICINGS
jgi:hypothetical protein